MSYFSRTPGISKVRYLMTYLIGLSTFRAVPMLGMLVIGIATFIMGIVMYYDYHNDVELQTSITYLNEHGYASMVQQGEFVISGGHYAMIFGGLILIGITLGAIKTLKGLED